jgi:hypothetical protein
VVIDDGLLNRFLDAQDKLVTQASDFSLATISAMVAEGSIDPSPEYQRRERWGSAKQSALIESFLLNVPVPPVYLAEEQFGIYSVIDGKQRITAIHDFMTGRLALRNLVALPELNDARISDLPEAVSNALRVRPYIRAVTLLKQSDPLLKYEVFLRLNRGGEALTAQEVRNVAFRGRLNEALFGMAENGFLRHQFNVTESSERFRKMNDVEYVLRFLALGDTYPYFDGDLAGTMDAFMFRNKDSDEAVEWSRTVFRETIDACQDIWGEHAFQRAERGSWRGRALLGMYDAQMLAVRVVGPDVARHCASRSSWVVDQTAELFYSQAFTDSVTASTNTPGRLHYRVNVMADLLSRA